MFNQKFDERDKYMNMHSAEAELIEVRMMCIIQGFIPRNGSMAHLKRFQASVGMEIMLKMPLTNMHAFPFSSIRMHELE